MTTILVMLAAWVAVSVPAALVVGRVIAVADRMEGME